MKKIKTQENQELELASKPSLKKLKWLKPTQSLKQLVGINRGISPGHVIKIASSIRKYGVLRPIVAVETDLISGKKELYIIDGQHSYNACLSLGIEVPYVVIDSLNSIEEIIACIAAFNASSKSWSTFDYVYAWASVREDYRQLNQLYEQFDLDFDTILTAATLEDGGTSIKKLKAGQFVLTNYAKAHLVCQRISDVFEIIPRLDRFSNRTLTRACASLFKKSTYTAKVHTKLLAYLSENIEQLKFVTSDSQTVKNFLLQGI